MATSEHVWKLDGAGNHEEWETTSWENGDDWGPICVLCDAAPSHRGAVGSERFCIANSQAESAEDWSSLLEQLRRYNRRSQMWESDAEARRDELAEALKESLKLKTKAASEQMRARQAEEKLADAECRTAQLRTRIAELELQLARHEEATHAEK